MERDEITEVAGDTCRPWTLSRDVGKKSSVSGKNKKFWDTIQALERCADCRVENRLGMGRTRCRRRNEGAAAAIQ